MEPSNSERRGSGQMCQPMWQRARKMCQRAAVIIALPPSPPTPPDHERQPERSRGQSLPLAMRRMPSCSGRGSLAFRLHRSSGAGGTGRPAKRPYNNDLRWEVGPHVLQCHSVHDDAHPVDKDYAEPHASPPRTLRTALKSERPASASPSIRTVSICHVRQMSTHCASVGSPVPRGAGWV